VDRNRNGSTTPCTSERVAPHAGAWIETPSRSMRSCPTASPLTQGRGSKLPPSLAMRHCAMSPLTQGRGSKLANEEAATLPLASPLTQGRGSKLTKAQRERAIRSRPSRRGVDRNPREVVSWRAQHLVAPHAGAWIETTRRGSR